MSPLSGHTHNTHLAQIILLSYMLYIARCLDLFLFTYYKKYITYE